MTRTIFASVHFLYLLDWNDMRSLLIFLTVSLVGSPLAAQNLSENGHIESRWDRALDFSLSPRVGNSLPVRRTSFFVKLCLVNHLTTEIELSNA